MLNVIDLGSSPSGQKGRVWVLDPIDGTEDFLRGGQYAVCLALLEDGQQKVGVLGCPTLNADATNMFEGPSGVTPEHGILLSAVSGQGATIRPISRGALLPSHRLEPLRKPPSLSLLRFVDKAESKKASSEKHAATAQSLGAPGLPLTVASMQLRWVALSMGLSDIFVRLPRTKEMRDWIWDHAGGVLIAAEVGVEVTDASGEKIDFGAGRRIENGGWVAAHPGVHAQVLEAVEGVC